MMALDGIDKLRHLLQTLAFCLCIAALHVAFLPDHPYTPPVAYSTSIGIVTWAAIDLGRHLFPSAHETGWPRGLAGAALVGGGIAAGFLLGTSIADQLCRFFGWYGSGHAVERSAALRTSLLITIPAGLVGSFFFYSVNKSSYLERKMGEARQHANEARLKLLEAQLEPHMLFNTLANLRALIAVDPPRAQQMLDHMIAYLRATLAASRSTLHPLQAEFDRLRDYLELMAVRMGPRMQYALHLPPELQERKVPALLLQPLVENAIQHGLEPQVQGGRIDVSARIEAGQLVLRVEDTGAGSPVVPASASVIPASPSVIPASPSVIPASPSVIPASPSVIPAKAGIQGSPSGFGLAQIRERLHTVYGDAATFRFSAHPGQGATAEIRLPLNE